MAQRATKRVVFCDAIICDGKSQLNTIHLP